MKGTAPTYLLAAPLLLVACGSRTAYEEYEDESDTGSSEAGMDSAGSGNGDAGSADSGSAEGDDGDCPIGAEGCPCTEGGSCDAPAVCMQGVCSVPGGSGDGDAGDGDAGDGDGDGGDGDGDGACALPPPGGCDQAGGAGVGFANTLGLNCLDENFSVDLLGADGTIGSRTTFGSLYQAVEGDHFMVLGSGPIEALETDNCSLDMGDEYDYGQGLPEPMTIEGVAQPGCIVEPSLVGMGDCSGSLGDAFEGNGGAFDMARLDIQGASPAPEAGGVGLYVSFMSTEYPEFWASAFNDIFLVWLESELWTGNIAYDSFGAPISVQSTEFMTVLDADASGDGPNGDPHPNCPPGTGCSEPGLEDTCAAGHGMTPWLRVSAPIQPGETIRLIPAVMDLGDSIIDSYAFVDGIHWTCEGPAAPTTEFVD